MAVYSHVFAAGEANYTWTTNMTVGGAGFIAAFGGVDTTSPIDASSGGAVTNATVVPTPSVLTGAPASGLVASYFGYKDGGKGTSWTAPSGMTEIGDASNGSSRSGSLAFATQAAAGSSGSQDRDGLDPAGLRHRRPDRSAARRQEYASTSASSSARTAA